jgi:hypothetical protein
MECHKDTKALSFIEKSLTENRNPSYLCTAMKFRIFILTIFLLPGTIAMQAQCSMCRAVAESGDKNGQHIANGLNNGILYLMAVPYLLLFVFFRKKIWGFLKELRALWN